MKSPSLSQTLDRLPDFEHPAGEEIVSRLEELLATLRDELNALTAAPDQTDWQTLSSAMEDMQDRLHRLMSPVSHLHHVANRDDMREPYERCVTLLSAFSSELAQHPQLFACYLNISRGKDFQSLDTTAQKVVANALRDFRLGGVDLDPEAQQRVRALLAELSTHSNRYEQNVLDATQAYKLTLNDEDELAGLPESVRALLQQQADSAGESGWLITLDYPSYGPVMSHLESGDIRESLYRAFTTRAADGAHDNSALMHKILSARQSLARELGFANYAELSLATKMAPSTETVVEFLRDLAAKARPAAIEEVQTLREFAASELAIDNLNAWDVAYAAEHLRQARLGISQEDLRPYFPVSQILDGLFAIVSRLFGLQFRSQQSVTTWHPDVQFFLIEDSDGTPRGGFYLDLFARARKRPGAWMDECLVRWRNEQVEQLPVAYLTCNFTPPVGEQDSLLTHDEVTTLFHEFGHGLHHLLTDIERPAVSGINGVAWDAVELPSQFLENWCWHRESLDLFARHHETSDPMPSVLFERLQETRRFQAGLATLRQIEFALFDFRLHLEYHDGLDIHNLLMEVRDEVAVLRPPEWNRFENTFSHIFGGGYAAGYYSYKWAEVLAADAFSRFEEEGLFNPHTADEFRRQILARGGSEDAMDLFRMFRGREPEVEPLLRQNGLLT